MNMQVGVAGGGLASILPNLNQAVAKADINEAADKLKAGDIAGGIAKLEDATKALKDAGKGAEPPGQKLSLDDLLKALRDIIEQGKEQSAENAANQASQGSPAGKGAEGGQQGAVQQIVEALMQVLQQMKGGGAS